MPLKKPISLYNIKIIFASCTCCFITAALLSRVRLEEGRGHGDITAIKCTRLVINGVSSWIAATITYFSMMLRWQWRRCDRLNIGQLPAWHDQPIFTKCSRHALRCAKTVSNSTSAHLSRGAGIMRRRAPVTDADSDTSASENTRNRYYHRCRR